MLLLLLHYVFLFWHSTFAVVRVQYVLITSSVAAVAVFDYIVAEN